MRSKCLLAMIVFALAAMPCLAQGYGRVCDPTGTWLGGSDPSAPGYQLTVVPQTAGRYSATYQAIFDPGAHLTAYTGELVKTGAQNYTGYIVAGLSENQAMVDYYASIGVTVEVGSPEVDAAYEKIVMLDCNTIQSTITWFGWYLPMTNDKIPFVTQPEVEFIRDFLGGEPIVETYHRVSADNCRVCTIGGSVTGNAAVMPSNVEKKPPRGTKR